MDGPIQVHDCRPPQHQYVAQCTILEWEYFFWYVSYLVGGFRSIFLSNTELNNTKLESFQIINGRRFFWIYNSTTLIHKNYRIGKLFVQVNLVPTTINWLKLLALISSKFSLLTCIENIFVPKYWSIFTIFFKKSSIT